MMKSMRAGFALEAGGPILMSQNKSLYSLYMGRISLQIYITLFPKTSLNHSDHLNDAAGGRIMLKQTSNA